MGIYLLKKAFQKFQTEERKPIFHGDIKVRQ
jgi:hypothetical protein